MLEYLKTFFRFFVDSLDWFVQLGKTIIDSFDYGFAILGGWIPQELWVIISVMLTVTVLTSLFKLFR